MPVGGCGLGDDGGMSAGTDPDHHGLDLARLQAVESDLAAVEHALGRLDARTWGTCEVCGGPVEADTLAEQPAARACAAHATPPRAAPDAHRAPTPAEAEADGTPPEVP